MCFVGCLLPLGWHLPMQSSSLQIPSQDSPSGPRPMSVDMQPPPSSSHRRQQRASHSVVSPNHPPSGSREEQAPYTDVYSHPAAMAYAAAHPRRTIPKFGPYLLLQTLGEGEFGKVKLGLHCQWGEEVAVKLIRRGNIDSSVRMSKVEREIEVLKVIIHPKVMPCWLTILRLLDSKTPQHCTSLRRD